MAGDSKLIEFYSLPFFYFLFFICYFVYDYHVLGMEEDLVSCKVLE